jgi:flagellar protein FliS
MIRRLIDASAQNDADALTEVIDLMLEIKGAWDAMPDEVRNVSGTKLSLEKEAV